MGVIGGCSNLITDGLILYLDAGNIKSYPGSGGIWYDLSDSGINGTMRTTTMGNITDYPHSMVLNNSSGSISFGHNSILEPSNITVSAWVNLLDRGDRHILLTKWYGWSFEISSGRYPYFRIYGSNVSDLYSNVQINWGQWHNILSTFDDDNNIRYIYIDGEQKGTVNDTGSISYNQGGFNIPYSNSPSNAYGDISIVQIYNRSLSGDEVKQNYNTTKTKFELI